MILVVLATVAVGAAAGCIGMLLGVGGGIFLVPFLNLFVGLPIQSAAGISLVTIIATSSLTVTNPQQRQMANRRLGLLLEAFTAPSALIAAYWAQSLSEALLRRVFAFVTFAVAAAMVTRINKRNVVLDPDFETGRLGGRFYEAESGVVVSYAVKRLPLACAASAAAGFLSGLLGIGGGILKVPVLNALSGVPMRAAAATSAFMIGMTVVASAIPYYLHGQIVPHIAAAAVMGVLAGGRLGVWLGERASARRLKMLFIVMLLAVGVSYLLKAAR
jgi:uncharacterized membrane protein YfcA